MFNDTLALSGSEYMKVVSHSMWVCLCVCEWVCGKWYIAALALIVQWRVSGQPCNPAKELRYAHTLSCKYIIINI